MLRQNKKYGLIATAALASAFMFLAVGAGPVLLSALSYFVNLPLFFAGLTVGAGASLISSAGALLIVLVVGGWLAGLLFIMVEAAPCIIATRLALQSREGEGGTTEWYPAGMILAALTVYWCIIALSAVSVASGATGGLDAYLVETLTTAFQMIMPAADEALISELIPSIARFLPGMAAATWLLMSAINAILAQSIAVRSQDALRPTPSYLNLELPSWLLYIAAIPMIGMILFSGDARIIFATVFCVACVPFFLLGLTTVHVSASRLSWSGYFLVFFYVFLVFFLGPLLIFVVVLGMAESQFRLKERMLAQNQS